MARELSVDQYTSLSSFNLLPLSLAIQWILCLLRLILWKSQLNLFSNLMGPKTIWSLIQMLIYEELLKSTIDYFFKHVPSFSNSKVLL
jgi:hypothetical protein